MVVGATQEMETTGLYDLLVILVGVTRVLIGVSLSGPRDCAVYFRCKFVYVSRHVRRESTRFRSRARVDMYKRDQEGLLNSS